MVPHGGYTVTNSPTRYAYPAPSHDIRSSRGAIFALKMANLGRLRNLLCLHFWLFKRNKLWARGPRPNAEVEVPWVADGRMSW
jgi:hypothetical protein